MIVIQTQQLYKIYDRDTNTTTVQRYMIVIQTQQQYKIYDRDTNTTTVQGINSQLVRAIY